MYIIWEHTVLKEIYLEIWMDLQVLIKKQTYSVAFSPQANYTNRATTTRRQILVPNFVDRGVLRGQRGGTPTVVNLSFLDRGRFFFFQVAHEAEWTLLQTHCYSENLIVLGIKSGTSVCSQETAGPLRQSNLNMGRWFCCTVHMYVLVSEQMDRVYSYMVLKRLSIIGHSEMSMNFLAPK
jgi:hypothetical protein